MNSKQRKQADARLRRLSRAVIQLAQAQAEVDAEAEHREHQRRGKETDEGTSRTTRKRGQA
jgi:hypothetical protein